MSMLKIAGSLGGCDLRHGYGQHPCGYDPLPEWSDGWGLRGKRG